MYSETRIIEVVDLCLSENPPWWFNRQNALEWLLDDDMSHDGAALLVVRSDADEKIMELVNDVLVPKPHTDDAHLTMHLIYMRVALSKLNPSPKAWSAYIELAMSELQQRIINPCGGDCGLTSRSLLNDVVWAVSRHGSNDQAKTLQAIMWEGSLATGHERTWLEGLAALGSLMPQALSLEVMADQIIDDGFILKRDAAVVLIRWMRSLELELKSLVTYATERLWMTTYDPAIVLRFIYDVSISLGGRGKRDIDADWLAEQFIRFLSMIPGTPYENEHSGQGDAISVLQHCVLSEFVADWPKMDTLKFQRDVSPYRDATAQVDLLQHLVDHRLPCDPELVLNVLKAHRERLEERRSLHGPDQPGLKEDIDAFLDSVIGFAELSSQFAWLDSLSHLEPMITALGDEWQMTKFHQAGC